jgi:hypothetical protein
MSVRLARVGISVALLVAAGGAMASACYDVPTPDCGFVCGPGDACPDGYTCANDHRCHRNGTPASLMCSPPDAAPDVAVPEQ